jgi:hypothetical protein
MGIFAIMVSAPSALHFRFPLFAFRSFLATTLIFAIASIIIFSFLSSLRNHQSRRAGTSPISLHSLFF